MEFVLLGWWNNLRLQVTFHPTSTCPPPPPYMDSPFVAAMQPLLSASCLTLRKKPGIHDPPHQAMRGINVFTILTRRASRCSSREYCEEPPSHFLVESSLYPALTAPWNSWDCLNSPFLQKICSLLKCSAPAVAKLWTLPSPFILWKKYAWSSAPFLIASSIFWIQCDHHLHPHGFCSPYRVCTSKHLATPQLLGWGPECQSVLSLGETPHRHWDALYDFFAPAHPKLIRTCQARSASLVWAPGLASTNQLGMRWWKKVVEGISVPLWLFLDLITISKNPKQDSFVCFVNFLGTKEGDEEGQPQQRRKPQQSGSPREVLDGIHHCHRGKRIPRPHKDRENKTGTPSGTQSMGLRYQHLRLDSGTIISHGVAL